MEQPNHKYLPIIILVLELFKPVNLTTLCVLLMSSFLTGLVHGRDTALDVTVVNPLQIAMVDQAAVNTQPGSRPAAGAAYNRKCRQTRKAFESDGMTFISLLVETLWGWHEVAISQIKKIGKALAHTTGQEENKAVKHLFQRLAVAVLLVKGNASLFINRIPTFPGGPPSKK